jgi:peptide/nickel transport system permease protein
MVQIVARRLVMLVPILLGVSILTFGAMHAIPGDLAVMLIGVEQAQDPVALENIRRKYGLDQPLPVQYGIWLSNAIRLDFGDSLRLNVPVRSEIARRLPVTIQLAAMSVAYGLIVGGVIGTMAAIRGGWWGTFARIYNIAGIAVPSFFLGTLLILFGTRHIGFIPTLEYVPITQDPARNLLIMIYPTIALGTGLSAVIGENVRSAVTETIHQEHVRVARAKGLAERTVTLRHVLKNSMIPVTTITGLQAAFLLSGTIIIESIFALPGLGRLAFSAINLRDYPLIQGIVLVIAVMVVAANLIADLLYALFDPRVRVS